MVATQQQVRAAANQFGPNVCNWPSALRDVLELTNPALHAACLAGQGFNVADLGPLAAPLNPVTAGGGGVFSGLTGINALGDLAQRLSQKQTWVRVGEALAGGIMIYVGLKAFFPSVVSTATAPVKKAAKASVFL